MNKTIVSGIVAGVAMLVIGMIVNNAFMLLPAVNADYHNVSLMRPFNDPLMWLFFAYPFVLGFALAWIWNKTKSLIKGKWINRGLKFGGTYWAITTIPGMLVSYSSFPISFLTIFAWTISGLVNALIAGMIFARMNK